MQQTFWETTGATKGETEASEKARKESVEKGLRKGLYTSRRPFSPRTTTAILLLGSTEMLWLGASAPLLYEAMLLLASTIAILRAKGQLANKIKELLL